MGLLDFDDNYKPPFTPPKPKRIKRHMVYTQEARDSELNNFDRDEVSKDFSDSPFADRV